MSNPHHTVNGLALPMHLIVIRKVVCRRFRSAFEWRRATGRTSCFKPKGVRIAGPILANAEGNPCRSTKHYRYTGRKSGP